MPAAPRAIPLGREGRTEAPVPVRLLFSRLRARRLAAVEFPSTGGSSATSRDSLDMNRLRKCADPQFPEVLRPANAVRR
jgi:hypothetical protein